MTLLEIAIFFGGRDIGFIVGDIQVRLASAR